MSASKTSLFKDIALILLIVVLAALAVVFFQRKTQIKLQLGNKLEELEEKQQKFDSLLQVYNYVSKKSTADELFIQGEYEKSFQVYAELVELTENSDLLNGRKNIFQIYMSEESKIAELQALKQKEEQLLANIGQLRDSINLVQKTYLSSLDDSKRQASTLKSQFDKLEKDLKTLENKYKEVSDNRNVITFRSSAGNKVHYIGDMVNNRANGFGIGIWDTGGVYKGEWRNNRRNGKGRYEWVDGEWYEGQFADDQREGFGVYYKRNGERFEGYWKENKRHGEGKVFDKNEQIINEGVWNEDNYVGKNGATSNGSTQK